jgi:hypothetical protein
MSAPAAWVNAKKKAKRPINERKVREMDESEEHDFIW